MTNQPPQKVFVIGLDCATPQLVFDRWRDDLPNLKKLMENGAWGELRSTDPPITVPAWTAMLSSKDPGQLGFYGFRNRKNHSYDEMYFANSQFVREDRVWDILARNRRKCIMLGIPQTYPARPVAGCLAASFLTPGTGSPNFTFPRELKDELDAACDGEYIIDVKEFRTGKKEWLLEQIMRMTESRFKAVHYLMDNKEWDFLMFVEMGVDRIHHGLWRDMDENHPDYEKGHPLENAIHDYYRYLDTEIGKLLEKLESMRGDISVMVVSDHGAKLMTGGILVNEWLIENGYLVLKQYPDGPVRLTNDMIDWSRTTAWGSGGYYGRLFMNVKGREPLGIVPGEDYDKVRGELKAKLEAICDPDGMNIGTRAHRPEDLYHDVKNIAPDLILYFGNLDWRSVGTVGTKGDFHTFENDTGPDDANHDYNGIFIMTPMSALRGAGAAAAGTDKGGDGSVVTVAGGAAAADDGCGENESIPMGRKLEGLRIYDVAPTILDRMGVRIPADMIGKPVK